MIWPYLHAMAQRVCGCSIAIRPGDNMGIVLRWREEPYDCEFRESRSRAILSMAAEGELVWKEPVPSAATACRRAREISELLLSRREKRA